MMDPSTRRKLALTINYEVILNGYSNKSQS